MRPSSSSPRGPCLPPRVRFRFRNPHGYRFRWSAGVKALCLFALLSSSAFVPAAPNVSERSAIRSHRYSLPVTFELNQGQTDARVDFLARGANYTLFLTATEAVLALSQRGLATPQVPNLTRAVMRMQLVDSARNARVAGLEELPGKVNYLRGERSEHWRTHVPTYRRVKYSSVYPGIDLIYYSQAGQLEYDFIVSTGADPSAIRLAFTGADDVTIDAHGDLVLKTAAESLRFHNPVPARRWAQADRRWELRAQAWQRDWISCGCL